MDVIYDNQVLLTFMICDIITGVLKDRNNFNVKGFFDGIIKKICILIVVYCAFILETILVEINIKDIVITYFIAVEGISLIENVTVLGVTVPSIIVKVLRNMIGGNDDEKGNRNNIDVDNSDKGI
jgi:toxin secretion/phage lysis holin